MEDGSDDRGVAPEGATEIRTFLIADVRGYTLFAQERGDEAAGKLAKRFADVAREGVEGRGGVVLELRGDEALVVFGSARQAIRAAVDLQERFVEETVADPSLPLRVGIGIDAGEAVPIEGGYRGRALNLAARLCGQAGAGEVLASREAVHLAGTVDEIQYVDRGAMHLKGLAHSVHVTRVIPRSGDPAERLKPFAPARARRRPRRRTVLIAAALVLTAVVVATALPTLRSTPSGQIQVRPGTVVFDPETGEEIESIPTSRMAVPGYPRFDGEHFWVNNFDPGSYVEIEPLTGRILKEISTPARDPDASGESWSETPYVVDGDTLWATSGDDVVKMDIAGERELDRFPLDELLGGEGMAQGVAVGAGSLWVSRLSGIGQVARLDFSGRVLHRWNNISPHGNLAFADGSLWVADNGGIARIDPDSSRVYKADGIFGNFRVAAGGGFGWTSNEDKGVVYKVDRTGNVAATYHTGLGAGAMAYADGTLWVANQDVGTVTGIDAISGRRTTFRFGHPVTVLAAGSGRLLTFVLEGRSIEDGIDALTGDVVKLVAYKSQIGDADPAIDGGPAAFQIAYATCAKLLNYPDRPAPEGWVLRPEVAAAMPTVSRDGLTYTFTVRPGYRFSPPENEEVTAETFRYSIERALSPRLGEEAPGPTVIDDIVGERAFREGEADTISGLRASGDTLTITLTEPSGDFLHRLALPYFCPVPTDTPMIRGGVARGGTGVFGGYHVPSTGPYYIADRNNEEYVILKRNPNYGGSRPQALDAIVLREGVDAALAVDWTEHRGWDGITTLFDPLLDRGGPLDARWGPGSDAREGDPRYVPHAMPQVSFIAFNAGRGIFADPMVRRAAALALDRSALAAVYAEMPTDQLFPPAVPGFIDGRPVPEPDLATARRLMDGRHGTAEMLVIDGCDPCLAEAEMVRDNLRAIGIDVRIRPTSDFYGTVLEPGPRYDLIDWWTDFSYPDPAGLLSQMLLRDVPHSWLPAGVQADVEGVDALTGEARRDAAVALAERLASEDVPLVAVGIGSIGSVVGPRIGCEVYPPFGFGVDLAALCLE